jgi:signal transduction histidine kinase
VIISDDRTPRQIVYNLLSKAVMYTPEGGKISLRANRQLKGTGLGLSLTKKLAERHGGRNWAVSEGEGRGSTFHVVIPV